MPKIARKEVVPEPQPKISEIAVADDEDSEYQIIPVTEIGPRRNNSSRRKSVKHSSRSRKMAETQRHQPVHPH